MITLFKAETDDLTVTCYFKNQHVHEFACFSEQLSHIFNTYLEINMPGKMSKHFRFMETHVVRSHVIFKTNLSPPNL